MSLYAVKNDKGEYAFCEIGNPHWETRFGTLWTKLNKQYAQQTADDIGGQVVPLIEAPAKVVVSEEEAEILKKLDREIRTKSTEYSPWKWLSKLDDLGMAVEDAYKALAIGWTVEKPKRWNVKVPHTNCGWYFKCEDDENENPPILDELGCDTAGDPKNWDDSSYFTAAEIEHYGLQDCERVEVTDDEQ